MNNKQNCIACALLIGLSGLFGSAYAEDAQILPDPAAPVLTAPQTATPEPAAAEPTVTGPTAAGPAASASTVVQPFPGRKISLAPLPVVIYLLENQKPTVTFTTPCVQMEKMTNGFPPLLAFENFMFTWIGNVNESNLLPVRIEPVCI